MNTIGKGSKMKSRVARTWSHWYEGKKDNEEKQQFGACSYLLVVSLGSV